MKSDENWKTKNFFPTKSNYSKKAEACAFQFGILNFTSITGKSQILNPKSQIVKASASSPEPSKNKASRYRV